MTFIPIVIGGLGTVSVGVLKVFEDLEIRRRVETSEDNCIYYIIKKSHGYLRRLTVIQTSEKDHQLTLI